ncbi:MAG: 50S ribosomal protein L9 [Candidatus Omnitrophota bacterium]|nr:MAG: 50S ribosomal protein L9 [Candidatus Omnitrophota bacterium]
MKVILIKGVKKIGEEGKIIEVRDGYARNYLIPKGFALRANDDSLKKLEEIKRRRLKESEEQKQKLLEFKNKLEAVSVTITAEVKEAEEIFGSINEPQIIKALSEEGIELAKDKIVLEEPLKKLGVYNLKVKLHPEVEASLRVWVVKK